MDDNIQDVRPIQKHTFFNFNHYNYGEAFFGSYKGMRYRLARDPLANVIFIPVDQRGEAKLVATVWPEPYAYGQTDPSKMTTCEFEFTEDGFDQAVSWFNDQYEKRIDEWNSDHNIID
ncbi:MAG: hypothetical protein K6G87_14755 [Butyrivibrio sp.]|uniref:hypothetical protein n=1 Tax=Butyrivibrio sp. TaxID=28121 RepID=UPI0025FC7FC6|nr:hypothetical protein [Butyrivibrio sp.]MCR5772478.1 hypothetical protein [Butyrivibrio sp.]